MTRRVVVTGATGHLGRAVVHTLAGQGLEVSAVSRSGAVPEPPFGSKASGNIRGAAIDLAREECVETLGRALGKDVALVHLAAWHPPATAATTASDRRRLVSDNVLGSMRVLDAARSASCACVVYASSFEVYGIPDTGGGAVTEDARLAPVTDYGVTKLSGEDHLLAFAYEQRTRVVALRFPAIYGPGESTSRALPNFLRSVAQGISPRIAGTGEDLRDQLHVHDAARAVQRALFSEASGIFNVADGEPHSIQQLASVAMRVAGMSGEPARVAAEKPRYDFHMNIERARRELGFAPTIELETGMAEQLAWLRSGQRS